MATKTIKTIVSTIKHQYELSVAKHILLEAMKSETYSALTSHDLSVDDMKTLSQDSLYWFHYFEDQKEMIVNKVVDELYKRLKVRRERGLTMLLKKFLTNYFQDKLFDDVVEDLSV